MSRKRERLDTQPTKAKRVRLDDKRTEKIDGDNGERILTKVKSNLPGRGPGRPPGSRNMIPRKISDAAILGFERHGSDGQGADGLSGFFYHLACNDLKAAAMIAARLMPQRVEASVDPQSVLGQMLEAVRARVQVERARTINGNALPVPATRIG
jgi:hypothetical protein